MTKKKLTRKEARKEIINYFEKAKKSSDKETANNYVKKARRLAMKYRMRLTKEEKRKYCKHCYTHLVPGKNAKIRTRERKVTITCLDCKKITRIPYIKEKKKMK